ncbi:ATP-binding protein [Actinospongicola halichondriae]|uniref:ATP-binding protein n=1 Tax=Actinospongicola halichondriae TaxID=3236844 RepID=UPI003D49D2CD
MADPDDQLTDMHVHELFEQSRVPTIVLDLNVQSIRAANSAAEDLLGLPREELIGRPGSDFIAEELEAQTLRERGLRGVPTRSVRVIRGGAGLRTAEVTLTPTSEDGVVFVQVFDLTDILGESPTDVLRRASVDPRRVLDASPVATVVVDLATRAITRINPSAAGLLGTSSQQTVRRRVTDLCAQPDDLEALLTAVDHDETGGHHTLITGMHAADGLLAVEITAVGLLDTPVAVLHVVPAVRDRPRRAPFRRIHSDDHEHLAIVDPERRRLFQVICGAALAGIAAVVLAVGWWMGVEAVTHIAPDLASMKANTALGFLLIGTALLLPEHRDETRTALYGVLVVVGGLTILEYAFGVDFGIDQLLAADDSNLAGTSSPGRMGLNTALGFVAIGIGALLSRRGRGLRATAVGQALVITAGGLGFLALLAYVYGATGSRGLASSTEMALHTSIAMITATLAVLSTQLDRGLLEPLGAPLAGGRFARRIMPLGVGMVIASGLIAKALARRDVLTDPDIELAFFALAVTGSLFALVVAVSRQNNLLDLRADRSRRDLTTVMAAFPDRHYRVDRAGRATAVTGTRTTLQTSVSDLVPTSLQDRLENALAASRTEDRILELTFAPDDEDGRRELRVAPLPSGEVAVSIRDISELAAARDALAELTASLEDEVRARTVELQVANRELQRSNSDLEQFAYLASHDLQEPLRMVSTFVDKLAVRLGDDLDDRSQQYVGFAVDGAQRMSDLIDGLLQYSRAGRDQGSPTTIALDDVVRDVLQALSEQTHDQEATIEVAPDLPAVWADDLLLHHVLQNLIGNALKFVAPERRARIRVDAERTGHMVEIGVADNGVGIPEEFREQVFLMFRRLHARTSYSGTGIGLALVQRLVESQGGRVWIDEDHGPHGTRFVFTVPATRPSATSEDHLREATA